MPAKKDPPPFDFEAVTDPLFAMEEPRMSEKEDAPHGRDAAGEPIAPYGYNLDGRPRKSNRGAKPGQRGNANSSSAGQRSVEPLTATTAQPRVTLDDQTRAVLLLQLADILLITPLASASNSKVLARFVGQRQTDALGGDALLLDHFAVPFTNGMLILSQTKPGALAWLDAVQDKAPWIMLANVGAQLASAIVANHRNPDPAMAAAGRERAKAKVKAMNDAIQREAQAQQAAAQAAAAQAQADAQADAATPTAPVNDFVTAD